MEVIERATGGAADQHERVGAARVLSVRLEADLHPHRVTCQHSRRLPGGVEDREEIPDAVEQRDVFGIAGARSCRGRDSSSA